MTPKSIRRSLTPGALRRLAWIACAAGAAVLDGMAGSSALAAEQPAPPPITWQHGQQLVVVVTADWDASSGSLRRYQRDGERWRLIGDVDPVSIGRSGSAWGLGLHPAQAGLQKREGDGRAPAGLFAIGSAFGYADRAVTGLDYAAMQRSHYCVDVPTSPLYNRIVDTDIAGVDAIAGSTEPMRRDLHLDGDPVYRLGFVIAHNADGVANAGSCIFAHLWRAPGTPTAGCTAMTDTVMEPLLSWLDRKRAPRFVLLPRDEYLALVGVWGLPGLE